MSEEKQMMVTFTNRCLFKKGMGIYKHARFIGDLLGWEDLGLKVKFSYMRIEKTNKFVGGLKVRKQDILILEDGSIAISPEKSKNANIIF